eukprot:COSAG01_NODE_10152_length_2235_cov_165.625000_2_plen_63_part_00
MTEIYLCGVCSCQEILRRHGRAQDADSDGRVKRMDSMIRRLEEEVSGVEEDQQEKLGTISVT